MTLFSPGLVALIYGVLGLACLIWGAICWQARRDGWRGAIGKLGVQASALTLIWGLIRGQGFEALFVAAMPPVVLLQTAYPQIFAKLIWALAPFALPAAGLAGALALAFAAGRIWFPGLAALAGLLAALIAAGPVTTAQMCRSAADIGATPLSRNSFAFSLSHAPTEFQFNLHGLAKKARRTGAGATARWLGTRCPKRLQAT